MNNINELKSVGLLLQCADKINKFYNKLYLKQNGEQYLIGYECMRSMNNGQLSESLLYLNSRLAKYIVWADQYGSRPADIDIGLVKWVLSHIKRSISGCDGVIEKYTNKSLTVNEKNIILFAYMGDIKIDITT